jgi:hypothetical protein
VDSVAIQRQKFIVCLHEAFPWILSRGERFKPWGEVKLVSFTGRQVEVVPQDNKQKKMSGESDLA